MTDPARTTRSSGPRREERFPGAYSRPAVVGPEQTAEGIPPGADHSTLDGVGAPRPVERQTMINQRNYEQPEVVEEYTETRLTPAESMIFVKYRDEIQQRRVLDVGCGTGRLIRYLRQWTPHVVGIDFSQPMIDRCRATFPDLAFRLCDVREVGMFGEASFDVALFSYNGMDTLSHESRLMALDALRGVLTPGGLYIFSTHNRRFRDARKGPEFHLSRNPLTSFSRLREYRQNLRRHRRNKTLEHETAEYAIINDVAHRFVMLHYYIDRAAQGRQLAEHGMELVEVYNAAGEVLGDGDDDSDTAELYYVARRV